MNFRNIRRDRRQILPATRLRNSHTVNLAIQMLFGWGTVRTDPRETPGEKRDNLQDSIEDARHKNKFTANDSMIDVFGRQVHGLGIIGTPN